MNKSMTKHRRLVWIATTLAVGLALGGCDNRDKPAKDSGTTKDQAPEQQDQASAKGDVQIEGDWILDADATRANVRAAVVSIVKQQMGDSFEQSPATDAMITQQVDSMGDFKLAMEFNNDGTCTLNGDFDEQSNVATGTWTRAGSKIILVVTSAKDNKVETLEARFEEGRILMNIAQEGSPEGTPSIDIVLRRK